ncbi:MAG TPA: hypothetical protein VMB22_07990 [Verrucomicrobiae bacterium]|nr:hypothetical protein [Verrucomicrobiae bacterium]
MKKTIVWSVVGLAIVAVAGLSVLLFRWLNRPQVMVFENGATLKMLGADYGKHHTAPPGNGRTFTTANDELVVWIRKDHKPGESLNTQFYVYDEAGTACAPFVGRGGTVGGWQGSVEVQGIRFDAFPRRQDKFYVALQYSSNTGDSGLQTEKFVISNPARGQAYPQWTAEPLPDTKEDGDLSVTLTKLVAGMAMPFNRDQDDPDSVVNKGVQAVFHVERNGAAATNWQAVSVQTSDATGNSVTSDGGSQFNPLVTRNIGLQNNWQDGEDTLSYQYGLWPDEPAWKVRVEFSQQSGFTEDETFTASGIPFKPGRQQDLWGPGGRGAMPTGTPAAETDLNGYHIKIFPAEQFQNLNNPQGGLFIQTSPPLTDGMRLTLVKITDNQTNDIDFQNFVPPLGNNTGTFTYELNDIAGSTNLTLTLALHQSHFVEFTVKPEKALTSADDTQQN